MRGNLKYDCFCTHCIVHLFKDDPRVLSGRKKSKELQVVAHTASTYDGFVHERQLKLDLEGGRCATKRRTDLRKLISNTLLCIEINVNQHYRHLQTGKQNRYDDLLMDFNRKYICIRYKT